MYFVSENNGKVLFQRNFLELLLSMDYVRTAACCLLHKGHAMCLLPGVTVRVIFGG